MDQFLKAFNKGQEYAVKNSLSKEASAADIAKILEMLGGAGRGASKELGSLLNKGKKIGTGAKYLGTVADPRSALMGGGGLALAASLVPASISAAQGDLSGAALRAGIGGLSSLGAGIASGANPGILGGDMASRMTHELAMQARTPAGLIGTMASVVGLPAALIAYGKIKGKEEASIF